MNAFNLTQHAVLRMSQRGIGLDDLELIEWIGTEVEGGHVLRERDFQAFERGLKRWIARGRRLVGKRVVHDGAVVVTVYHAGRREQRRLFRTATKR
jgi:hypothetical protein